MKLVKKLVVALMILSLALPLVACEKEGPAEEAGRKIDKAMDDAKNKAKELLGD